jgi:GTP pyrophosphokinase
MVFPPQPAPAAAPADRPASTAPAQGAGVVDPLRARELVFPLYADRCTEAGEPLAGHAEALVQIVRAVRPDADLLAAAYLFAAHEVVRDADRWLRTHFGASVAQLVADLRQLRHLSDSVRTRMRAHANEDAPGTAGQEEALRRMLLAMVNDMRVVVLRLASRLQTLRFLAAQRRDAQDYARETRALYAPLANRLGIWQFKWELEDLALRFLEPQHYQRVARLLEEKRGQREQRVAQAVAALEALLRGAGIAGAVSGRPKHIASIAAKMRAKDLEFERVLDQRALRVVVERVAHCYEVLALVHQRWRPVEGEYDDYIAKPKANGYQSLHTVVLDDDGRALEIQIRTRAMHEQAELGVAAHWRYKEGGGEALTVGKAEAEKVAWLRRLLDWQREVEPAGGPQQADRVYALTPQGRVVELPQGATAVDFAYHIHTELGHRCRGARVDRALVSLNTPLRTGQTVEIVSARSGGPSRDWLNPELGFLASARSRTKVRQWFHAQEHEQSVAAGREIITRELQRLGRTAVGLEDLARRMGYGGAEALCAAANTDEFSLRSVEQTLVGTPVTEEPVVLPERPAGSAPGRGAVLVVGVDSLLTSLARCCHPIPPDPIIGFVTRGKGISVHRASCTNARGLMARTPERLIEVQWDRPAPAAGGAPAAFPVEVLVLASDRQGLLRDISEVFAREKLNVIGVNTHSQREQAQMQFTVEVPDGAVLRRALAQLAEVKGVTIARRK